MLIEDFAKIDQFSNCGGGSGFDRCSWMVSLGKKDNEGQYILFKFPSAGFYALNFPGLGTLSERFTISKYNFKSQKLEKVETEHYEYIYMISWVCLKEISESCDLDCADATKEIAYQMKCFDFINNSEFQEKKITQDQIKTIKEINFSYLKAREKYAI